MIKYILQGIGMLFVRPKSGEDKERSKATKSNHGMVANKPNDSRIRRAKSWSEHADLQRLYDFIKDHKLEEIRISVNGDKDVTWVVPVVQNGLPGKNVYCYSPKHRGLYHQPAIEPSMEELRNLIEDFSPEIGEWFSDLPKNETLTLVVGDSYVELEWFRRVEPQEFFGERGFVIAGDPVRSKLRAWFKKNHEEIERRLEDFGVVRVRGTIRREGVTATFVVKDSTLELHVKEPWLLCQDEKSTRVIGRGELGEELARYFNECEIGKLKERLRPWVEVYTFEFGTYSSLTHTSSDNVVEVLFPEA